VFMDLKLNSYILNNKCHHNKNIYKKRKRKKKKEKDKIELIYIYI